MAENMIESTRTGTTRSSSYLTSIFDDNEYLELVWKNGQVVVHGGSSRPTQMNTPSRIGYSHGDSHQSSYQNSCQLDLLYSKSKSSCSYKLEDGCVISRPVRESKLTTAAAHQAATTDNGCLRTSSKQDCLPSDTFKKPRMDSSQTTASNSLIQDLGKVINFSNALGPSVLAKSTHKVKSANEDTAILKVAEVAAGGAATCSKATGDSAVIDSSRGSRALIGPQGKNPLVSDASKPVCFVARSQEPLRWKQAEAVGHNSVLRTKRKADANFCNEPLLESSSVCSLGASNNPDICSRKQAGTDVSTRISDNDEDTEDALKEKDAREGKVKRSRNAETHNLSERKRRDKINKKMRVLKELIPNCNKVDKASMLDDAIEYLKTLQLQLQIMSMGTGLSLPLMMLPTGPLHHMINTPHLPQLMGAGMGFRPGGAGIPPCNLPQFSIPPQPCSITDNRVRMFGFPNQLLPMPMSHAPFIPMVGKPSTQPLQATCTATNLAENLASAQQLSTLKVSGPSNSL